MYYFAPDSLEWEPLGMAYSEFLRWSFADGVDAFYEWVRWPGWGADVAKLHGDRCFCFSPPLFTAEAQHGAAVRAEVPVEESWGVQMGFRRQLLE